MTRDDSSDKPFEVSRTPTPTEQVRALPRVAHDTYHHMPKKVVDDAIALAKGSQPKLAHVPSQVRVEREGEKLVIKVGNASVTMTREEARELGATLMQLAR